MSVTDIIKKYYIKWTGYSYTNMGRLFLRLFVGIMLIQFAIRQINFFETTASEFPAELFATPESMLTFIICLELICSIFIMIGFCTRIMTLPLLLLMTAAEYYLFKVSIDNPLFTNSWQLQPFLPVMFSGIYFFILLVGPGKISIDYFLSLHFIHTDDKSESELEEV